VILWLTLLACERGEPRLPALSDSAPEATTQEGLDLSPFVPAPCDPDRSNPLEATGSSTIASHQDLGLIYALNEGDRTLSRLITLTGDATVLPLAGRPGRVAALNGRVYVTLRDDRSIQVFEETGSGLVDLGTHAIGHEPLGLVAHHRSGRLFVALAGADQVLEVGAGTLQVSRSWEVPGQPRWLAVHPDGCNLYVASAQGGRLSHVDLVDEVVTPLALPALIRDDGHPAALRVSLTGDPAISPDGSTLLVPSFYVDVETPADAEDTPQTYAPPPAWTEQRLNPVAVRVRLQEGRPVEDSPDALLLVAPSAHGEGALPLRSYPASMSFFADAHTALATLEGSAAVVAFRHAAEDAEVEVIVRDSGALAPPRLAVETCAGPRGLVLDPDGVPWVHCLLDQAVAALDTDAIADGLAELTSWTVDANRFVDTATAAAYATGAEPLPAELDLGRRLFYDAIDPRISRPGTGVSCATCHFDGGTDGATWPLLNGPRQTPSLAGEVSATVPLTWTGDVDSIESEAHRTSTVLMGGTGLPATDLEGLRTWVDQTPLPDRDPGAGEESVARGETLFQDPTLGCADCHPAPLFTDGLNHAQATLTVNTPTLLGIGATAPYWHDGRSPTLAELLQDPPNADHAGAAGLGEPDLADLEAYLRAL